MLHFTEYDTRVAAYAVIVEEDRMLLTWFNGGSNGAEPGWSLPGGGVEYDESVEEAIIRETKEEAGYDIALDAPLTTNSFTHPVSLSRPNERRPYKSVRILYSAHIIGGTLGTLEVGGTTDRAEWLRIDDIAGQPHADIVALAVSVVRSR